MRLLDACGLRLAEPVVADVDSPPWDRAMMDGFAVRAADVADRGGGVVELDVVVDLAAGDVTDARDPARGVRPDHDRGPDSAGRRRGRAGRVRPWTALRRCMPAGVSGCATPSSAPGSTSAAAGRRVSRGTRGARRRARVLGAAADRPGRRGGGDARRGRGRRPRVAILSTGSELVPADAVPAFGQTRNSNGPMLAAAVRLLGAEPIPLGIAADRPEAIRAAVAQGLAADVLVLSGGVSAGDLDLVPAIFAACGVEKVFHKVRLKPGKPVWFGVLTRPAGAAPTLVFGLPGNPASSLVCFELFVRPAIAILAGLPRDALASAAAPGPLAGAGEGRRRPARLPALPARPRRRRRRGDAAAVDGLVRPASASPAPTGYVALPAGGAAEAGDEVEVVLRVGQASALSCQSHAGLGIVCRSRLVAGFARSELLQPLRAWRSICSQDESVRARISGRRSALRQRRLAEWNPHGGIAVRLP